MPGIDQTSAQQSTVTRWQFTIRQLLWLTAALAAYLGLVVRSPSYAPLAVGSLFAAVPMVGLVVLFRRLPIPESRWLNAMTVLVSLPVYFLGLVAMEAAVLLHMLAVFDTILHWMGD